MQGCLPGYIQKSSAGNISQTDQLGEQCSGVRFRVRVGGVMVLYSNIFFILSATVDPGFSTKNPQLRGMEETV